MTVLNADANAQQGTPNLQGTHQHHNPHVKSHALFPMLEHISKDVNAATQEIAAIETKLEQDISAIKRLQDDLCRLIQLTTQCGKWTTSFLCI